MLKKGDEPIPGYRLVRFLGEGGFGQVWEAEGEFGVRKALKFINVRGKIGLKEYRGIQRVKDIRQANLMQVTDIWMLDENWAVLQEDEVENLESTQPDLTKTVQISEFKEGGQRPAILIVGMTIGDLSLESLLAKQFAEHGSGIPLKELLSYMRDAAKGIDYLNMPKHPSPDGPVAIQHCDIKPANMMLVGNTVVICDFGLAHVLSDQNLTATGLAGAPAYISPEMLRNQTPTATTDQYSLACSYYHLRTGLLPIHDTTSQAAMFAAHEAGKLDFSGIAGSRERSVLGRATHLNPKKRYESCGQFIEELSDAIKEDRRTGQLQKHYEKVKWRRRVKIFFTLVVLSVIGFAGFHFRADIGSFSERVLALITGIGNDEGTNGNGKEGNGGKSLPNGTEDALAMPDLPSANADGVNWDNKLIDLEDFVTNTKILEGEVKRRHSENLSSWLDKLLSCADRELNNNADPGIAAKLFELVLTATKNPALTGTNQDSGEPIRNAALLGRARASARTEPPDWSKVDSLIKELGKSTYQPGESKGNLRTLLEILASFRTGKELRDFFSSQVIDPLDELFSSGWQIQEEFPAEDRLFSDLLDDVAQFWDQNQVVDADLRQWAHDPRLDRIFGGTFETRRRLIGIRESLLGATPPSTSELDTFRAYLEQAANGSTSSNSQSHLNDALAANVKFLRSVLELRDEHGELDLAVRLSNETPVAESNREQVCRFLVDRLELEVPNGPLPSPERPDTAESPDAIGLGRKLIDSLAVSTAKREKLDLRLRAVQVVNDLWQKDLEPEPTLLVCKDWREKISLGGPMATVVDACWLEHTVAELRQSGQTLNPDMKEVADDIVANLQGSLGEHGDLLRDYCAYVLAYDAVKRQDAKCSTGIAHVQPALDSLKSREFIKHAKRGQFLGAQLLVDAADELRSTVNEPLLNDAYTSEAAVQAVQLLESAERDFGTTLEEGALCNLMVAQYYSGTLDDERWLPEASRIQLNAANANHGYPLFVLAVASSKLAAASIVTKKDILSRFAGFLEWQMWPGRSLNRSNEWRQLYAVILEPALRAAQHYDPLLQGFRDVSSELIISDEIDASEKKSLATIFGTTAELAESSAVPDLQDFTEGEDGLVRHRYFWFRAASELSDRKEARFLVGQYWALFDLNDSTNTDFDKEARARIQLEQNRLAESATILEPNDSAANAIRACQLVLSARKDPSKESQRETFLKAVDCLNTALRTPGHDSLRFYLLRSTTFVELSFLLDKGNPDKPTYLNKALSDAQVIINDRIQTPTAKAYIALGHVEEDLGFYLDEGRDDHFRKAIEAFEKAENLSEPTSTAASWALGRCRVRFAQYLYYWKNVQADELNLVREQTDQAINYLQKTVKHSKRNDLRAEAYRYLIQAFELRALADGKEFESDPDFVRAESELAALISELDSDMKPKIVADWVFLAIMQSRNKVAVQRAKDFLDAAPSSPTTSSWNWRFRIARAVFLINTDDPGRVIDAYMNFFPTDDPAAAPFRFKWLMLLPDRDWNDLASRISRIRRAPDDTKLMNDFEKLTRRQEANIGRIQEALQLAEDNAWEDQKNHAKLSLASLIYCRQFHANQKKRPEVAQFLPRTASALSEVLSLLEKDIRSAEILVKAVANLNEEQLADVASKTKPIWLYYPSSSQPGRKMNAVEWASWQYAKWYGEVKLWQAEIAQTSTQRGEISKETMTRLKAYRDKANLPNETRRILESQTATLRQLFDKLKSKP